MIRFKYRIQITTIMLLFTSALMVTLHINPSFSGTAGAGVTNIKLTNNTSVDLRTTIIVAFIAAFLGVCSFIELNRRAHRYYDEIVTIFVYLQKKQKWKGENS